MTPKLKTVSLAGVLLAAAPAANAADARHQKIHHLHHQVHHLHHIIKRERHVVHREHRALRYARHALRPELRHLRGAYYAHRRFHWRDYRRPAGWYHRHWHYGEYLPRNWWGPDYWITDWNMFGLAAPPAGYAWVRAGPDAVLIDVNSGLVLRAIYGLFY